VTGERTILHVDMDAFYASVEQRDDPSLRGKPLIVGGTGSRGVVAAASYEVRPYGVRSAMPVREALRLCPHAICIPPRMSRYVEVSDQVFALFAEFTPEIEGLSLDEAFLDVTHSRALLGDGAAIARAIKTGIAARTGLTASVGVAPNKLVAKIASDLHKPDGLCVVTPDRISAVLDPLPVARLPGLGRKLGEAVRAAGIATLGELRQASDARLWPLFGRDAAHMRDRAAGRDERAVCADREDRSISSEETFEVDVADPARLLAALLKQADRVGERLRGRGLATSCVALKLRDAAFRTSSRRRTFAPASSDRTVLAQVTRELFAGWQARHPGTALRLVGVAASELVSGVQADLFAPAAGPVPSALGVGAPAPRPLDAAVDEIRRRYGTAALRRAGNLRDPDR
jgi:DNA polymerase-4